jgi:GGDEF domain-containing protein
MSLQGPILIVAKEPDRGLAQAFIDAGAFPVLEASWAGAATAAKEIKPAAIVLDAAGNADQAAALSRQIANAIPFLPVIMRLGDEHASPLPDALTISDGAPVEQLLARVAAGLRLRTLHSTAIGRAKSLREERNIVAELAAGDPLDDATVLLIGRGRHHATLSVAVGERMGVMGALSVEQGARCLNAREFDGIVIGDGLPAYAVDTFLTVLAEDTRFRDLPVAVLGLTADMPKLPNLVRARDPETLVAGAAPAIRMRAREVALKRLLKSIECKGMLDADTGLFNARAFADALSHAIEDCGERGSRLSLARFSFEEPLDRRTSMDVARLVSRLVRNSDFACRQDDGSILFTFVGTDLRDAHVAARRLASVLRHTMLRVDRERLSPSVTLAVLKPADTVHTLLARVVARPVAAA